MFEYYQTAFSALKGKQDELVIYENNIQTLNEKIDLFNQKLNKLETENQSLKHKLEKVNRELNSKENKESENYENLSIGLSNAYITKPLLTTRGIFIF